MYALFKANQVYLYVTKRIFSTIIIQWRIQDFPEVAAPTVGGGGQHDFAKFSQKLHEIERNGGRGGGGVRSSRPLRSATVILLFFNEFNRPCVHMCAMLSLSQSWQFPMLYR